MSIFHAIETLKECETVLAALRGTAHDQDEYLLHDRTREQHARSTGRPYRYVEAYRSEGRGRCDHGGPFIAAFMGRDTGNQNKSIRCLTGLPYLVIRGDKVTPYHETNSRYTSFKVGEIKEYLIADILHSMDYYAVREDATKERDLPAQWAAQVQAEFPNYLNRKLRIETDAETGDLMVALLDPIRATTHGFGTFLEDIQPGEVSISPEAANILAAVGEQHCGGLPTLSAWAGHDGKGPILAGMLGFKTRIPRAEVSIPPDAWNDLKSIAIIE